MGMNGPAFALALLGLTAAAQTPAPDEELQEVVVTAPEARYVAPTTRDRIGRVWVPVMLDGKGPFRLVLDTGAQHSAVTPATAERIGIPLDRFPPVLVHGVTGSSVEPAIRVETLQVGDLLLEPATMPVVPDVFGGADGLLGTEGMRDQRIFMDFRHDIISIRHSKNRVAPDGYSTVRFLEDDLHLLVVKAEVGNVSVRAIFDTGAQATVGNLALQAALRKSLRSETDTEDRVQGATGEWQTGTGTMLRRIRLGSLSVQNAHVTFADLHIFKRWGFADQPALVIGMDVIGLVDELVIDYRRQELQIKPRGRP
jgi:predicted aspartyl protease